MVGLRARIDYVLKHNQSVQKLFNLSVSSILKIIGLFVRQDKNLILFSGLSRKYNDSPKAIYEYMLKNSHKYQSYKYVWALDDTSVYIPGKVTKIKTDTLSYFIYSLRAKYWVACVNIERSLHYKKKSCVYLNTWHGTPFKYIGNDAKGRKDFDFSDTDVFCYASSYEYDIYKRAFKLREDSLIPSGLPRNDRLYHISSDDIRSIKKRLKIPLNKKVILYAPTWRDSTDGGKTYSIAPPMNPNLWQEKLGDEYVILFRMHGYTTKIIGLEFNDILKDFSEYPDINDLFLVSDILISDYSASMADYSILERPIICFAYDYENYKSSRGLYLDLAKEMPSGVLKSENEVIDYIKNMNYDKECRKTRDLVKYKLIYYGGNATKACIDKLFGKSVNEYNLFANGDYTT